MGKRKHAQVSAAPALLLKPLQGAQIEAVTKTYNDLRAAGVDSVVNLPATVVAGDTSSGKSSVMCRLTGLPFPRGEGVVTRFATEVDMMPADTEDIRVSIRPDKARSPEEQAMLARFNRKIELSQFEETFFDACDLISQLGGRTLKADILHISLKSPACRPLTVIDLPGLIHAPTQKVSDADRKLSETLAKRYISERRTIILAVLSASNDVVNQSITRLTREVDKGGERTLGIVTKVDTVCGKAKDSQLFNILSNEEIPLKLGWHALVNVIESDEETSDQKITEAEQEFFKAPRFKAIDKNTTGIDKLRNRIVQVVGEKLVNTLPALQSEVVKKLAVERENLAALGQPLSDVGSQRRLLMKICHDFQELAQAELNGVYSNDLLLKVQSIGDATEKETLRSDIESLHHDFASAMMAYGGTKKFQGLGDSSCHFIKPDNAYNAWSSGSYKMGRTEAIEWVKDLQEAHSRSGISGSVNDQVFPQLFRELSRRWAELPHEHIDNIAATCKDAISELMDRSTKYSEGVANQIEAVWIHPHLDAQLEEVKATLNELERDTFMTLKTYTPRLDKLQEDKLKELYEQDTTLSLNQSSKKLTAITTLMHVIAYYEVDLEYWITAVVKQVAERFVRCIPKALPSDLVLDLTGEQVTEVMTEAEGLAMKRKTTEGTIKTMEFALSKLDAQLKCLRQG